jgi:hypothetical protein
MAAIITEIEEAHVEEYFKVEKEFILRAVKQTGLRYCSGDVAGYQARLEVEGLKYWSIGSAIGLEGFVVAKAAAELPSPEAPVK